MIPKIIMVFSIVLCFGCYNPKKFDITIEHKNGKMASMQVTIEPKYIKVTIKNKNFIGTNSSRSYKRSLNKDEAISFYNKINRLKLDTLKSVYVDSLDNDEETNIIVARKEYSTITANLKSAKTPATDSLIKWVDKLILNDNFKYKLED